MQLWLKQILKILRHYIYIYIYMYIYIYIYIYIIILVLFIITGRKIKFVEFERRPIKI